VTEHPSWLAALDAIDLAEFGAQVRDAVNTSVAARDAGPLEACLRDWRVTAEALPDPQRRAADDCEEVPRP